MRKRKDVMEEDLDEEEDLYTESGALCMYDDDEISAGEEAFIRGYLCL